MSRVPRIRVAPASRQKQLRRKLPGRTAIALAFGLAALLGLATLGASARLRSQSVGDSSGSQALSESSSSGKGSHGIEFVPGDILVRYRSNARARREEMAASQLFRNGREIPLKVQRFEGSNLVEGLRQARVQPEDTLDAIAELRADPDVLYAAPNYIRRKAVLPNDPRFGEVWALKNTGQPGTVNNATFVNGTPGADIDAELAWTNYTTGSGSVVVGIIDTGIDVGHPDLVDNIWVNPGEVANDGIDNDGNGKIDDINGWDFAHNDKTVFDGGINDPDDHGTHVAGTIGAKGNNGVGVAGINWDVKLMSLKFLTGKDGFGTDTSAIAAFTYAKMMRDRGVNLRVLNCSWGSAGSNPAVKDAIDSVGESGILVVAAAGNAWTDNDDFPEYPASFDSPNLVRVSATDRVDDLAEFSNFGTRVPGIGAPGRGILSTTPRNYPTAQATYKEPDGSTYTFFSGTSMATPQVSGVAALLLAQYPGLSVQRLRGALLYSGEVLPSLLDKVTTGRRLNAKLALDNAALNDTTPPTISGLSLVAQNGRNLTLQFATGDDGTSGNAALYDVYFTTPANLKYHLGSFLPTGAGNPQSISVLAPYKQTTGTLTLYVIDDAGNIASSNVAVTLNSAPFEPYAISLSAASPLSAGGDPLSLSADDKYKRNYALPFDFPFYGKVMKKVTISTNGALYFSAPLTRVNGDADDVFNDLNEKRAMLNLQSMIAGMWDDLRTDRFSGDVFVTKDADHIIFRWQGSTFASDTDPINFEIELRRDGTIQMRYGSGNTGLKPLVGISGGQTDAFLGGPEDAYVISSHSQPSVNALTNAQTVTFTPQAATPVCTYSISPTTRNIGSDSAGGTIAVTAGAGCAWTATSNDSFIIITSSASGTGNGNVSYSLPANTSTTPRTGTINIAGQTFTVTQAGVAPPVQLGVTSPGISESQGFVTITVNRSGDLSGPTTVKYATSDTTDANFRCDPNTPGQTTGVASRKCDYHIAVGTLRFAAGETTKQFTLSVVDDVYVEGTETFNLTLTLTISTPIGVTFGQDITVPMAITDDDTPGKPNPIDNTRFFVRQLYVDLLSREPDPAGWNGWTTRIDQCGQPGQPPPPCDRVTVAGDGFLRSGEFFDRQFFVIRLYRTGLGRILRYDEVGDLAFVSGFLTAEQLELNKQDLVNEIITRGEFASRYNVLNNGQYVDTLLQTAGVAAEIPASVRQGWITALDTSARTRAQVYREISERQEVSHKYAHEAQVVSAYYGFFTRNPDGAYLNYLQRLDSGEINLGDLANAFINAAEYRQRFGP